ncbi:MAG: hypothetical protein WEB13_11315 [Dehalococcoidia bacterium]
MTESQHAHEVVAAFCALEPADAWAAFRAIAADPAESEDRRLRAAAWLGIANAVSSLQHVEDGED